MAFLEKKAGAIYYEVHGEGEAIVILRGLGRSIRHWLGFEQELAAYFKVITLDLRGMGRSTIAPTASLTIYDLADDVVDVLNTLNLEAAHIMGVSLGGMVTLAMGLKYPERCQTLIPINTSISGDLTLRLSPKAIKTLIAGATVGRKSMHEDLVGMLVGGDMTAEARTGIAERYKEIERDEGLNPKFVLYQLLAAGRFLVRHKLKKLKVPTLVLYGTDDRFVPTNNSRRLVGFIPGATLMPIKGAGHEVTLDRPQELTKILREWVKAHGS